jgi:ribose transport system substrate-binding protein
MRTRSFWPRIGAAVALLAVTAACGTSGGGGSNAAPAGGSGGSAAPVPGVPTMDQLYAGTYSDPPSTSPPGAKGQSVWWISCSQTTTACSQPAAEAAKVASILGMDFHIADQNFNVGGQESTVIRTAIAAGAKAIALYGGAGCEGATAALQEAKAAGILLLGVETPDCSAGGGPQVFNVTENFSDKYPDVESLWRGYGAFSADYIINKTGGTAKIINQVGNTQSLERFQNAGFVDEIKSKCPGCQIVGEVPYVDQDLSPSGPWIQAFRSTLVRHPEATAVYMPWDVMMTTLGGVQAVKETGRDLITFGGQAAPDSVDYLRQGKLTSLSSARDPIWSAYAAMDTINRALNGQKTFPPEGLGYQVVDATHNLPASGDYTAPGDYKAKYLKAWNNGAGTA